ncbi:amino acid permease [Glycomyces artemisiae]|uniref:Amino acid/polyamine/organocation transporter (APC superfamily) n=1 Tax=Glycomyces artemisiae TaxID=1076443 RepID=A0A2T0UIA0_9ACTN|nr:amino acid permease [Glycomyces artemisiae]PRY57660.1 amino acid/polyamine/organocation transporter (APC superfamily) [Glycomyces artemisiae]
MTRSWAVLKRLLVGEPFASGRGSSLVLSKRYAIPLLAINPISSIAYAPEQVFLVLGVAGTAAYALSPWTGLAVAAVMVAVIASYRYTVQAYPGGGGDYRVVTANFGPGAGRLAAAALVLDYILTVAVSTAAAVAALDALMPGLHPWREWLAAAAIALLAAFNLRGLRVSGRVAAAVTVAFVAGVAAIVLTGLARLAAGEDLTSSAPAPADEAEWTSAALFLLCARAFAAGSVAVTGVETFTTRVRFFRPPRGRNAAAAITTVGAATVALFIGTVVLAFLVRAQGPEARGYPLLAQLSDAVFGASPAALWPVMLATAGVLLLAANTAFVGFPQLASVFAEDSLLPRQLHKRGDRLVYSNGILILAVAAALLVVLYGGGAFELIGLYVVGVFLSMVLSHAAMSRHWRRVLDVERDPARRARAHRARATAVAAVLACAAVLVIVAFTMFRRGGWIAVLIIGGCYLLMRAISRHYAAVRGEIEHPKGKPQLPSRSHAIVLASSVNLPLMRMLSYAKATRPDTVTALTVNVDAAASRRLVAEWDRRRIGVPLTVLDSPYREITGPIVDYVKARRRDAPRDVVTVYLPEYVVGLGPQKGRLSRGYFNWSTSLLHNQTTKALHRQLKYEPGVMVCTVPWILGDSTEPPPLRRIPK